MEATVSALPARTTTRVTRIASRRCAPDPIRPSSGAVTAPLSSVTVSVHWAAAKDTCNCVATLVISGAPRLPTAAATSAMKISVGTNSFAVGTV